MERGQHDSRRERDRRGVGQTHDDRAGAVAHLVESPTEDPGQAETLIGLTNGIGLQAAVHPTAANKRRARETLARALAALPGRSARALTGR